MRRQGERMDNGGWRMAKAAGPRLHVSSVHISPRGDLVKHEDMKRDEPGRGCSSLAILHPPSSILCSRSSFAQPPAPPYHPPAMPVSLVERVGRSTNNVLA